jgi:hypothetical protein
MARAQDPVPVTPAPQQPGAIPATRPAEAANDAEDHRIFGVVPNYKTVNDPSQPVTPIGPGEKFQLVLHYFDPFTFAVSGIQAGVEQMKNEKESYGQGALGYSKRYGADFTDAFTNELFVVGVFPSLLHEDPRYFRRGQGGGLRRMGYSLSRIVVARTDSGGHRFNFSEFLGNFTSGSISQTYYPREERGIGGIFSRMTVQIGYDALFNVFKEFYPDLKKKLHRN